MIILMIFQITILLSEIIMVDPPYLIITHIRSNWRPSNNNININSSRPPINFNNSSNSSFSRGSSSSVGRSSGGSSGGSSRGGRGNIQN